MDNDGYKFVEFEKFCHRCEHQTKDEHDEKCPCYECIATPVNLYSHKPINFKEKEN